MVAPTPFSVILPAGGSSQRFGRDKLMEPLANVAVIARTVALFANRNDVAEIVIATNRRDIFEPTIERHLPHALAMLRWTAGGASRAETVRNGLEAATSEWVAIHDAARPLAPADCIGRVFEAAIVAGAAAPALPVKLTIKQAVGPLPAKVIRTLPRQTLFEMQTPQAMRRDILSAAYQAVALPLDQLTDDTQLIELIDRPVTLVAGDERNIKITTLADLHAAERLLADAMRQRA